MKNNLKIAAIILLPSFCGTLAHLLVKHPKPVPPVLADNVKMPIK
jgi:hypothetical protein